jgi:hypothetical protein
MTRSSGLSSERVTMIEVEISGDANNLSPNKRLNHWAVSHRKAKWRGHSKLVAESLITRADPRPLGRVRISFVVRRARRLDPDNAASSQALKAIVDGFRDAGLLKDDTADYCERGSVTQEIGKQYKLCPSVIVRLEACEQAGG